MNRFPRLALVALVGVVAALIAPSVRAAIVAIGSIAAVDVTEGRIEFRPQIEYSSVTLTIAGPDGFIHRQETAPGKSLSIDLKQTGGQTLKDGSYVYHLHVAPVLSEKTKSILESIKDSPERDAVVARLQAEGALPSENPPQSGAFAVSGGRAILGLPAKSKSDLDPGTITPFVDISGDNGYFVGSICVGLDCVSPETFGFDTIRMKENNTRIKFEDTSLPGFPTSDWQLTANDSAAGGLDKFSIEDITAARVPFTVEGGAPTDSIYVDSTGRVGFRTSTPVLDLHVNTSNTPAIRLEQNNSGGFTAQTWDIAGNEANFFIRDVTGGSRLPLRIRPGAPTSSIDITSDGDVGFGTGSPQATLHLARTTGVSTRMQLGNPGSELAWDVAYSGANITGTFIPALAAPAPVTIYQWDGTGNLTISGVLTQSSDRNKKENFAAVDGREVLARVAQLPVSEYNFKEGSARHVGPMAQDFHSAFGVGPDEKHIAPLDAAGIALAAIQGLDEIRQEQHREIERLKQDNEQLAARLAALESLVEDKLASDR